MKKTKKEGKLDGRMEITKSLIIQTDFNDEKIAGLADASPDPA